MFRYVTEYLQKEFTTVRTIKKNDDKTLLKVRHIRNGEYYFVRFGKGDPQVYRRLLNIKSKNVPEIFETASENDRFVVIEEYIPGDPLDELLKDTCFTRQETVKTAVDICRALYTLHKAGIVHRDVKAENVRIRQGTNDAILLDFDASRTMKTERERDTVQLGTAGYAAPEQYGISQTDGRADIYALGVLMNIMLTGSHPSEKLAEGRLGRIISRCTMVHPDKRYTDALRLMEALDR